jgi:uridine kinase
MPQHKIHVLICGEPRSIDLVANNIKKLFKDSPLFFYVCANLDFSAEGVVWQKKLIIQDEHDDSYRNALNYANKVHHGLKLLELASTSTDNTDVYFIIRSDCIIEELGFSFSLDEIEYNTLYVSNIHMNQFTKDTNERVCENIIITRSLGLLDNYYSYMLQPQNTGYLDVGLYNYILEKGISYIEMPIRYKLILRKCNIIAISGDSGSGKSTLMQYLMKRLEQENYVKTGDEETLSLETDRYHKWERGNENYNTFTHLNPMANHIDKMCEDVYQLKMGNEIFQVDYNHETGTFTSKEKIEAKQNIIVCGLHTLYHSKMNEILDLKIFMDTDRNLIKYWKIQRDVKERGYSIEKVLSQMKKREDDYEKYIIIQKDVADIVVQFYTPTFQNIELNLFDFDIDIDKKVDIRCRIIIQNELMFHKILKLKEQYFSLEFVKNDEQTKDYLVVSFLNIGEKDYFYNQLFNLIKN